MNTQIRSKLAAFTVAVMMNCLIMGAVAQLFGGRLTMPVTTASVEPAAGQPAQGAA